MKPAETGECERHLVVQVRLRESLPYGEEDTSEPEGSPWRVSPNSEGSMWEFTLVNAPGILPSLLCICSNPFPQGSALMRSLLCTRCACTNYQGLFYGWYGTPHVGKVWGVRGSFSIVRLSAHPHVNEIQNSFDPHDPRP